jgi:aspartyl-tRNA(Asn)/glutamyl-tRNA(Gln) amidotransferase subunit A
MLNDSILFLPLRQLAARLESRKISPVELTESFLARSEKYGPRYNAYATLTRERALRQAHQAEREIAMGKYRGPLHGIPYAAKDLLAVRGYPTTWGARPYANQHFDYDAAVIENLDRAGAILIGKAAMIELAGGMGYRFASASLTGPAKNPWNAACWTCGSSSGSGAIVAAGLAAFAIGTETWGSILCPSGFCGRTGLRPTFGRVSRWGAMALSFSMDKIGPIGRTADDCALVLAAIAGHDSRDRSSLPNSEAAFHDSPPTNAERPLRIGWLTNAWEKPDPDIAASAEAAIAVLKAHRCQVADAQLPVGPWEDAGTVVVAVEGASAFQDLIESGRVSELTDPLGQIAPYVNQQIAASDYMRALRVGTILRQKMEPLFTRFDIIAAPTLPVTATTLETNLETDLSFADPLGAIGNLLGLPAISVPCGLKSKAMPIGIQFLAQVHNDALVLDVARLYQQHSAWASMQPPID